MYRMLLKQKINSGLKPIENFFLFDQLIVDITKFSIVIGSLRTYL